MNHVVNLVVTSSMSLRASNRKRGIQKELHYTPDPSIAKILRTNIAAFFSMSSFLLKPMELFRVRLFWIINCNNVTRLG